MNYIELINQFWQTRRRVRLTGAEADLYFFLLQECNLRDWDNPFECPNGIICGLLGISEDSLNRTRNRLQQKGFIKFVAGQKNSKSPTYFLGSVFSPSSAGKSAGKSTGKLAGKSADIIIKQKQKQKHNTSGNPPAGDAELPLGISAEDRQEKTADICDRVQNAYHRHCKGLPPIRTLTSKRRQMVKARIQEHGEATVFEMLEIAGKSKFLAGQNTRQWTATFDWLFKPTNFVKTLERNFDDKTKQYDNGRTVAGGDQRKCFSGEYSETF